MPTLNFSEKHSAKCRGDTMGADIKKLRSRIKSVDSTLHLTKAMGLVASSKIRRATNLMTKANEYSKAFSDTALFHKKHHGKKHATKQSYT